jgi:hypothetical protein
MSYLILKVRWCNIIVLNVHAPCEGDDVKDSFFEELGRVFDQFLRYDVKILLDDFNAIVGMEDIFKPTIGNEISHEISDVIGVRVVKFFTSKTLVVRSTMVHHRNIHKYAWNSPGEGSTTRLLSTSYAIFSNVLLSGLTPHADEIIGERHCGFRRNRSTTAQISYIRQMQRRGEGCNIMVQHVVYL